MNNLKAGAMWAILISSVACAIWQFKQATQEVACVARFQETNLRAALLSRTVMGEVVVDLEEVSRTFPEGVGKMKLLMIYEVRQGRIARAWSIAGEKMLD